MDFPIWAYNYKSVYKKRWPIQKCTTLYDMTTGKCTLGELSSCHIRCPKMFRGVAPLKLNLSVHFSVCPSVRHSICPSVHLSIYPSVRLSGANSQVFPSYLIYYEVGQNISEVVTQNKMYGHKIWGWGMGGPEGGGGVS